jgi:DNA-binding response OmpR family regulator
MKTKLKIKRTILVIEDEKPLLAVVKTKLEKSGFQVITSRSVLRAFATELEENKAGIVTMTSIETP